MAIRAQNLFVVTCDICGEFLYSPAGTLIVSPFEPILISHAHSLLKTLGVRRLLCVDCDDRDNHL